MAGYAIKGKFVNFTSLLHSVEELFTYFYLKTIMYERRERKESALRRSNRVSLKQFAFIYMCRHRIVTKFCIDSIEIEFSSFENNRLQRVSILQFLERIFGVVPVRSLISLDS